MDESSSHIKDIARSHSTSSSLPFPRPPHVSQVSYLVNGTWTPLASHIKDIDVHPRVEVDHRRTDHGILAPSTSALLKVPKRELEDGLEHLPHKPAAGHPGNTWTKHQASSLIPPFFHQPTSLLHPSSCRSHFSLHRPANNSQISIRHRSTQSRPASQPQVHRLPRPTSATRHAVPETSGLRSGGEKRSDENEEELARYIVAAESSPLVPISTRTLGHANPVLVTGQRSKLSTSSSLPSWLQYFSQPFPQTRNTSVSQLSISPPLLRCLCLCLYLWPLHMRSTCRHTDRFLCLIWVEDHRWSEHLDSSATLGVEYPTRHVIAASTSPSCARAFHPRFISSSLTADIRLVLPNLSRPSCLASMARCPQEGQVRDRFSMVSEIRPTVPTRLPHCPREEATFNGFKDTSLLSRDGALPTGGTGARPIFGGFKDTGS